MKFVYPICLWFLPALLLGGFGLRLLSRKIAARKLAGFGPGERLTRILHAVDFHAKERKYWIVIAALCLLALVAARPMKGPRSQDTEQSGAEFFIILDVSKSMLVRDVPPNRLQAVKESLDQWLKTRHGDRIGLILVAGDAFVQAPLTNDYTALREVLKQSGPGSLSRGGTNLAGAIQIAMEAFRKSEAKTKALVIVSDGESLEGNPGEAARQAHGDGIAIFTVGVGTEDGGPVPEFVRGKEEDFTKPPQVYVKDEYGVQARSRLDERSLRSVATAGGGRYYRFTPDGNTWAALYTQSLQPLARQMKTIDLKDYDDLFQIPLFAALLLLAWEMSISTRLKNPPRPKSAVILPDPASAPSATKMKKSLHPTSAAAALLLSLLTTATASASTPLTIEDAQKLVRDGKAAEAAKALWTEAQQNPNDPYPMFNYGIAAYADGKFNEAIYAFTEVAGCPDEKLRALALTNLGNAQYRLGKSLNSARNGEGAIVSWERAVEFYESAVKERKDSVATHNLEIAREDLQNALKEVGAKELDAGKKSTDLTQKIKQLGGAFEKFEKASALDPKDAEVAKKLEEARTLLANSLRDQAREHRDQAVKTAADAKAAGKEKPNEIERSNLNAAEFYEQAKTVNPKDTALAKEHEDFKKAVANDFADKAEANLRESAALDEKTTGAREAKLMTKQKHLTAAITDADKALGFDEKNERAKDLKSKAVAELEKAYVERGDIMKDKGDDTAAKTGKTESAANQYEGAMDNYRKALEINPDNEHAKTAMAEVQGKLAAELAKNGEKEMDKANKALEGESSPKDGGDTAKNGKESGDQGGENEPDTAKLEAGIAHLNKAAQSFGRADALDPGKNNAAEQGKKASDLLNEMRSKLDAALAKKEKGKGEGKEGEQGKGGEQGENGENGMAKNGEGGEGEGEGGEGPPTMPQDGNQQVGPRFGGGKALLNFSEIRGGSEKEGQFVDKTRKETIRDW